jgi:phosphate transport system protein
MANSVIGILDGAVQCLERVDTRLARTVLMSDDAVDAFEQAIIREVQQGVADRIFTVDFAFAVSSVATMLDRVDDHCTNIAEQVIYVATGKIVRHQGGQWSEPAPPE